MFLIDEKLSFHLLEIRKYCCLISKEMTFLDMGLKEPLNIDQFKEYENKHVISQSDHIDLVVNTTIKDLIEKGCKESLDNFKEENRIRNKDKDDPDQDNLSPPMLAIEDGQKEMPYTQEATIRTHYKRLKKFIRLVDFMVLDSKLGMMNQSIIKVHGEMEGNRNVLKLDFKNNGGYPTLINVRADFIHEQIEYIPNSKDVRRMFDDVIVLGVNHICGNHKMLLNSAEFSTYVTAGQGMSEGEEYTVEIYKLITQHETFTKYKALILQELEGIFSYVIDRSADLRELLEIVVRTTNFGRKNLENKERADCYAYIEKFIQDDEILKKMVEKIDVGLFCFDRTELKEKIIDLATDCLHTIEEEIPEILTDRCNKFDSSLQFHINLLSMPTMDVAQIISQIEYYTECRNIMDDLNSEYNVLIGLSNLFTNDIYRLKIPEHTKNSLDSVRNNKEKLRKLLEDIETRMDQEIKRGKKELESLMPQLETELSNLKMEMKALNVNNEDHNPQAIIDDLKGSLEESERLMATAKEYNNFQDKLDVPLSDIEKFSEFKTEVMCFKTFWEMKKDWLENVDGWMRLQVSKVDGKSLSEKIKKNINTCNTLLKEVDGNTMFKNFRTQVESFKSIIIVVNSFQEPAMRPQEWEKIRDLLKSDPEISFEKFSYEDDTFTLNSIRKMNIFKKAEEIQDIAIRAAKEKNLLKMLVDVEDFMKSEKSSINTDTYKDTKDVFILGNNDELIKLLDDKIVTITNILSSRYVHGIKDKVVEQKQILDYYQEFLDELGLCQRMWLYLEPIFNGEDSNRELMKERKTFKKEVHTIFTKQMREINDNFNSVRKKINKRDKNLMKTFKSINLELEQLEKNLISYLEKKRLSFARFFFVSNDDLIEILANGKDIDKLQPHLGKLFEAIKKLEKNEGAVTHMISPEGEKVMFKPVMNISLGDGINEILNKLEVTMIDAVSQMIKNAMKQIKEAPELRADWIFDFPA